MKSVSIQVVELLFENPLSILNLYTPQIHDNITIIPLSFKGKILEFITVKEAEELSLISINETETVSELEIINKSDQEVLIPFGITVSGGKQDRTIWEPILLPVGGKQNIFKRNSENTFQKYKVPAKCVEQSRWTYKKGKGFKSTATRLHPNVAFEAISAAGQNAVWNEIQSYRSEMNYDLDIAPTQSYLEMTEKNEKEIERLVKAFNNVDNQCGIAAYINGEFVGIEFYSNPKAWKSMSSDIIKAFATEALRFKDKQFKADKEDYHDNLRSVLQSLNLNFSVRNGIGLGEVVEFESQDKKWRGNTLVHENSLAQFYLVSKRGGSKNIPLQNYRFQTNIQERFI